MRVGLGGGRVRHLERQVGAEERSAIFHQHCTYFTPHHSNQSDLISSLLIIPSRQNQIELDYSMRLLVVPSESDCGGHLQRPTSHLGHASGQTNAVAALVALLVRSFGTFSFHKLEQFCLQIDSLRTIANSSSPIENRILSIVCTAWPRIWLALAAMASCAAGRWRTSTRPITPKTWALAWPVARASTPCAWTSNLLLLASLLLLLLSSTQIAA